MEYEWEDQITDDLMDEINDMLPDGIALAGLAVFEVESVEGALIHRDVASDMADADLRQDILGDAKRQYVASGNVVFRDCDRATIQMLQHAPDLLRGKGP